MPGIIEGRTTMINWGLLQHNRCLNLGHFNHNHMKTTYIWHIWDLDHHYKENRSDVSTGTWSDLYSATVWDSRGIDLETTLKVYRAVVLPTCLYVCESWTVYKRHARKPNHFHTTRLRSIMNIKWHQRIPDTAVLSRAKTTSIHTMLMKHQVRWAGHLVRMDDSRIPKQLTLRG